jgi:hypothetical protein
MIKLIAVHATGEHRLLLSFSDGCCGEMNFLPLLHAHSTALTLPLRDPVQFQRFFLELGALAWPNGLEFSARSLHHQLEATNALRSMAQAA